MQLNASRRHSGRVPRFYFNLFNDVSVVDDEGLELPDLAAAQEQARRGAAQIIAEVLAAGKKLNPRHRLEVQDESGHVVHTLMFSDFVEQDS